MVNAGDFRPISNAAGLSLEGDEMVVTAIPPLLGVGSPAAICWLPTAFAVVAMAATVAFGVVLSLNGTPGRRWRHWSHVLKKIHETGLPTVADDQPIFFGVGAASGFAPFSHAFPGRIFPRLIVAAFVPVFVDAAEFFLDRWRQRNTISDSHDVAFRKKVALWLEPHTDHEFVCGLLHHIFHAIKTKPSTEVF